MGFNFRKSFKIAPGVRLNVGKKGLNSVSIGGKGARVNVGKRGTRTTISAPRTGLSHTFYKQHGKNKNYSIKMTDYPRSTWVATWITMLLIFLGIAWLIN
ncbi:MAG: DUF4236 domain-containing protein [Acinetobacter sp.]